MKKSFESRLRSGLFPAVPQSFEQCLQNVLTEAGAKPRKFHLRKVWIGAAAAVLAAASVFIAIIGIAARGKKLGAKEPAVDSLSGKWTVTEIRIDNNIVDPKTIGDFQITLELSEDGNATLSGVAPQGAIRGDIQEIGQYTVTGNTVILTDEGGDTLELSYDPAADTLYMEHTYPVGENWDTPMTLALIFSHTPNAVIPADNEPDLVGKWTLTEMIWDDGRHASAEEAGVESTLTFQNGTLTELWTVNANGLTSRTEYRYLTEADSVLLRANGIDVNDPEITYDPKTDTLRLFTSDDGRTCIYIRMPDLVGKWTLTRVETIIESSVQFGIETVKWGDVTDQIDYESFLEFTADGHVYLTMYFPDMGEALHDSATYTLSGDSIITEWSPVTEPGAEKDVTLSYDAESDTICMESNGKRREYFSRTPDAVIPAGERKEITELRKQYPEYFGLDTSKGLKVYVWQMAESDYSCALLSGTDERSEIEIGLQCKGTTIEQMRLIYSTYDAVKNDIDVEVVPFHNPISSYWYEIDKAYTARVKWLLLGTPIEDGGDLLHEKPIDTAVYDVDGDGLLESCRLSFGPTSGLFTVVFHVYRNGTLVYLNTFNMAYGELYLNRASDGLDLERVSPGHDNVPLDAATYRITIENGVIVLTDGSTGETVDYWGTADTTWNMKVPAATPEKRFGGAWYCYDKEVASYPGYDELLVIEFDPDGRHVSFTEDRKHYEGYTWQTDADDPNVLILTNETTGDVRRATKETDAKLRFETDLNARGERSEWTYYDLPVFAAEDLPFGESASLWFGTATDPARRNGPLGMFDLDGDGKLELIRLTWNETDRKMTVEAFTNHNRAAYTGYTLPGDFDTNEGERYYTVENVTYPGSFTLIDLDPSDGHVNLLVSAVTENGEYTYELHVENGELVCGHVIEGYCYLEDSEEDDRVVRVPTLVVQTDLFGADGYREVRGEALEPVDDRLYASAIVDAIYFGSFGSGREKHIEDGTLLHLVRALPCEIDDVPGTLEPDVYIFLREWNDSLTEIVFMTEDWRWITVHPDAGLLLDGVSLYDYFDNAPER